MKKTEFYEASEGRIEITGSATKKEREAFFAYLDKVRETGVNYADIEFSAGSGLVIHLEINLDKNKWQHPLWPKASATIRMEQIK